VTNLTSGAFRVFLIVMPPAVMLGGL